jgi:hypothetical protein
MESCEPWQRSCPPQGAGTFAYFCCRAKVWRLAVRVLPVLTLTLKILLRHKKLGATDSQSVALIPLKQFKQQPIKNSTSKPRWSL